MAKAKKGVGPCICAVYTRGLHPDIVKNGTALATYAYDTAGRLVTRTLANGVVSTYTYDMANRLESIVVAGGSTVLWAERYGYNAAGERIFTLKGITGTVGDGYWLDATSQLRGVKYGSANATLAFASQSGYSTASTWQYDAVGNRTEATEGAGTTTYATNTINQYTSVSGVTPVAYSARGDLTQFGDWTYTYDATGNLIRAHNGQSNRLAKYARDVSGHRAVKDVDGAKTVYFNWGTNPLEAWQMGSSTSSSTVYEPGIDRPLAEIGNSGAVAFFYHQDWLGNVVMLSNAQGQVSESYSYDVWGKVTAKDGAGNPVQTPQSRFLFTARELDPETGLYHYRARAYSAELGRFLQTDPIDFAAGDENLYRYGSNSPTRFTDPFGLWCLDDPWESPFGPQDPIDWSGFTKPPKGGSSGGGPRAGETGGTRAWDHSPGGGGGGDGGGGGGSTLFMPGMRMPTMSETLTDPKFWAQPGVVISAAGLAVGTAGAIAGAIITPASGPIGLALTAASAANFGLSGASFGWSMYEYGQNNPRRTD